MPQVQELTYYSWGKVDDCVKTIEQQLPIGWKPSGVFGLPRGGLIPAVIISHDLDIPLLAAPAPGCLIVDDIADTGVTLKHYKDSGYKIAVLVHKFHTSSVTPDFSGIQTNDPNWVVFPWEKKQDA